MTSSKIVHRKKFQGKKEGKFSPFPIRLYHVGQNFSRKIDEARALVKDTYQHFVFLLDQLS